MKKEEKEEESVAVAWLRLRKIKRRAAWTSGRTTERKRERERRCEETQEERERKGREGMNERRASGRGVAAGKAG